MRRLVLFALFLACAGLVGCGGGSTTAAAPTDLVEVQGKLLTRDGTATALDGVTVSCPESGDGDVTDAAGDFRMQVPVDRPFHVDFHDPVWPDGGMPHDGMHEPHDPVADATEADGGDIALGPVRAGDTCRIEVHLQDGEVVECDVSWGDAVGAEQGEERLDHDPYCDQLDSRGEIEVTFENGCLSVEVEVEGLSGPASYDVYLVNAAGEEAYLATLSVDGDGVGHLEGTWCEGDALPFDAATPADLAGYGVVVYDEAGEAVFRGHLPYHHAADVGDAHGGMGGMGGMDGMM